MSTRKNAREDALEAKKEVEYVRQQIAICLDKLENEDADLDTIQEQYNSLAVRLRDAADQLEEEARSGHGEKHD